MDIDRREVGAVPTIGLVGSFDTKGEEYAYLADAVERLGATALLIDVGVLGKPQCRADVPRDAIARAAGSSIEQLLSRPDRAGILGVMAVGLSVTLSRLVSEDKIDAAIGMGGSGAVTLLAPAWVQLPAGMPKLILTTMPETAAQSLAGSDGQVVPSLVDVSGLNSYTCSLLDRLAATAVAQLGVPVPAESSTPMVAASMFGVTTVGVVAAAKALERAGYDVLTFHANGAGGRALESMAGQRMFAGVLDLTSTELADELLGGKASAGPGRFEAAGAAGVPQVVSIGALDIANFGAIGTVPEHLQSRTHYQHGPLDILVRTSASDGRELGRTLAGKLAKAEGPVTVILPSGGPSSLSELNGAFRDAEADGALIEALVTRLPDWIKVVEVDAPLNSVVFGERAAAELTALMTT